MLVDSYQHYVTSANFFFHAIDAIDTDDCDDAVDAGPSLPKGFEGF